MAVNIILNGLKQTYWANKQVLDTLTNDATFTYKVNYEKKLLEVYSSIPASLTIT